MAQLPSQTTAQVQQLLSQLRDIRGLADISWWPLAPGWWILLGLLFALAAGIFLFRRWQKFSARRFEAQVQTLFDELLNQENPKKKATALSEILRLLAMRRYGRKACAGLAGEKWLFWLCHHDPKQFDWVGKGRILIEAPYMPDNAVKSSDVEFEAMIKAAQRWMGTKI